MSRSPPGFGPAAGGRRARRCTSVAIAALLASVLLARPAYADARAEVTATDALQKSENDFLGMNYPAAIARLNKALHVCGANRCAPPTKAMLLRDLGTMQFRTGDKAGAAKSWADALALHPTLSLNPSYDASDVGAAWEDSRAAAGLPAGPVTSKPPPGAAGTGGAGATAPTGATGATGAAAPSATPGEQPTGDFAHDPALEQREDTPLPIHVEYGGSSRIARVVVKYKGAQMRDWTRIELTRLENNRWEGLIPCIDVTRGTMRYWIQGFDETGEPIAATGDPKHPYYVAIRDKITSPPPHLPNKEPPRPCDETDCPPGLPGCIKKKSDEGGPGGEAASKGGAEGGGATEEVAGEEKKAPAPKYARLWVGVSGAIDFLSLSTASDVCKVASDRTPLTAGYYCYDSTNGVDFPSTSATNNALTQAGTTVGGVQVGDVRILLAFDYALMPNILAGARVGYVLNAYPGSAATNAGHAMAPVHLEARMTYLLGHEPLSHVGVAPMAFLGFGASEFDGHQTTNVNRSDGVKQPPVDVWLTDAPFFILVGAGARYQASPHVALTGALRLNMVIGGNGFMPTYGPELGVLYGF
jgi:hypothetical protein